MMHSTDYAIVSAAHALLSMAPSQQQPQQSNDVLRQQHSTSPNSAFDHHHTVNHHHQQQQHQTMTNIKYTNTTNDDMEHYFVTPSSVTVVYGGNDDTDTDDNNNNNKYHRYHHQHRPIVLTSEYPTILNVPQRPRSCSRTTNDDNSFCGASSSSSSILDTDSESIQPQPQEPARQARVNNYPTAATNSRRGINTTIMYRPQEITSYNHHPQQLYNYNDNLTSATTTSSSTVVTNTVNGVIVPPKVTNATTKKNSTKQTKSKKQKTLLMMTVSPSDGGGIQTPNGVVAAPTTTTTTTTYYEGSVSLRLKEDEFSLSPLHCFMRQYCVEAFTASSEEVTTPRYGKSHGRSISIGQVGIQCVYCKHRPYWLRQERAVCFPSTLKNIYHSIETWQRRHSVVCTDIPLWAKDTMSKLMGKSRSGAGGRRQYWEESATQLGMVDTPTGIRFICRPGIPFMSSTSSTDGSSSPIVNGEQLIRNDGNDSTASCTEYTADEMTKVGSTNTTTMTMTNPMIEIETSISNLSDPLIGGKPVVLEEDKELVTDFLFTLLNQMETCYFSEQDRIGGRSKVKDCSTGYPGLQCKHCGGRAGFGRYYPISIQALTSANSDRNIYNHVEKCRRCPTEIREELEQHLKDQLITKNRRGNRKEFFQRIWERMHGPIDSCMEIETSTVVHEDQVHYCGKIEDNSERYPPNVLFHPKPPQHWQRQVNDSNGPMVVTVVPSNTSNMVQHISRQPNVFRNQPYTSAQLPPPPTKHFFGHQMLQQLHQRIQEHPELWQQQQQQQRQVAHHEHRNIQPPHHLMANAMPFYTHHNQLHQN